MQMCVRLSSTVLRDKEEISREYARRGEERESIPRIYLAPPLYQMNFAVNPWAIKFVDPRIPGRGDPRCCCCHPNPRNRGSPQISPGRLRSSRSRNLVMDSPERRDSRALGSPPDRRILGSCGFRNIRTRGDPRSFQSAFFASPEIYPGVLTIRIWSRKVRFLAHTFSPSVDALGNRETYSRGGSRARSLPQE